MKTSPLVSTVSRGSSRLSGLLALLASLLLPAIAPAQTFYWDSDGATPGAGTTPSGTWGTSAFWTQDSTGSTATSLFTTTALSTVTFCAGSDATGSYAITLNGTQNAKLMNINNGTATFSSGTLNLGSGGGITVAAGAGNPTISSNLGITGLQTITTGAGRTLALNTGTFTRVTGSVLNLEGTGTVTSTMTNLSSNTAGIVGAWATVGTGASTQFATFSGSTITGLTGTAAAAPANVTDTTGLVNYDLSTATGSLPATVSADTIRFVGTGSSNITTLGATSTTLNGLMNTDAAAWQFGTSFSTKLTIGSSKELVVNSANSASSSITILGIIQDNGGGASGLTYTGSALLSLGGNSTYTGTTTIASGTLSIGSGTSGSLSPSSVIVDNGTLAFARSTAMVQGTDFSTAGITGTGGIALSSVSTTVTLNAVNTYSGVTNIGSGTLMISGSGTLGNGSLVIPNGGKLDLGGTSQTIGSLSIQNVPSSGNTVQNGSLTATSYSSIATSGNAIVTANLLVDGSAGFAKSGAGTVTLAGANTYTGATTVAAGTLLVNGSIATSATTVSGTGTLGGTAGTTGSVTVNSGGTLLPGASTTIGVLDTGAVSLNASGTFHLDLNTSTSTASKVDATGNLSLDPASILALSDLGSNVALTPGTTLPVIDYSGTWNGGTFAGLPNDSDVTLGANQFEIIYNGSDSSLNAVTLTVVPSPEPGSAVLLGAGALLVLARRRRALA